MRTFIVRRAFQLLFLLWALSAATFFFIHLIPGDPAIAMLGEGSGNEDVRRIRSELRLDRPVLSQYLEFNRNLLNGSLGRSFYSGRPVIRGILPYLPNTLWLALSSLALALLISLPVGVMGARKAHSASDWAITLGTAFGLAMPHFLTGLVLILVFSVSFRLLPVSGDAGLRHLILPALTLAISMSSYLIRVIRTAMAAELKKPYVLLARAKGLTESQIIGRHIWRNALVPILTVVGLQFGALLTGAVVTESVFSWQGIGALLLASIHRRDYPMIQGAILLIAAVYMIINFLIDLAYLWIDPRIRRIHETLG